MRHDPMVIGALIWLNALRLGPAFWPALAGTYMVST
jgi:hypothetical protein